MIVKTSVPVAILRGEPLLFKGNDFNHTDINSIA